MAAKWNVYEIIDPLAAMTGTMGQVADFVGKFLKDCWSIAWLKVILRISALAKDNEVSCL